jgi:trimethylamine--corrinoid protein Co-methyltransferase
VQYGTGRTHSIADDNGHLLGLCSVEGAHGKPFLVLHRNQQEETGCEKMKLELLSRDQIEDIHSASIRILEEVGVLIHEVEFLRFLARNGVNVDIDKKRARLSPELVHECIKKTPKHMTLYSIDRKHDVELGDGKIYAHPVGGASSVIDLDSLEVRYSTLKDVEDLTRIVDALPNIHTGTMIVYPSDVTERLRDIYAVEAIIRNTSKNFDATPYDDESYKYIIQLIEALVGEEDLKKNPIVTCSASPTSPLQFSSEVTKVLARAVRHQLPIAILPCPLAGATSPVTLAGTLVQQNAEMLAGLVIVQLLNPGNSFMYSPRCIPLDMSTGQACDGIESALMSVGCVQLARHYGLPCDVYGLDTDSKTLDEQVAFERAIEGVLPAMAGVDMLSGAGCIEGGITVSYEQLVIDDEIFGMIFRATRGIDVDEDKLAVDVIMKVARESSNFLQQQHTLKHFRGEYYFPKLCDRSPRSRWQKVGAKSIVEIAREKAKKILAEHKPPDLDADTKKRLSDILKTAAKNLTPA